MRRANVTAILVTAGISSRFWPIAEKHHKTLFKIGGKPLLKRTIEGLVKNGIKDIVAVYAPGDKEGFLSAAKGTGSRVKYVLQKTPLGTGNAVKVALPHIPADRDLIILNGGQLNTEEYLKKLLKAKSSEGALKILSAKTNRPWDYAVLKLGSKNTVEDIIEKPKQASAESSQRTVGFYYAPAGFRNYILKEKESPESLINAFNKYINGFGGIAVKLQKEPTSIKYAFDVLNLIEEFTDGIKRGISKKARLAKNVVINGEVHIADETVVMENAVINGPVWIGKNCVIGANAVIRPNTVIEDNVKLGANTEAKHSYIGEGTHIHSGYIGDSIVAENCRIGAGFITANRRTDRQNIKFSVKEKAVDSDKSYLGAVIGANTKIGVRTSTMPGAIVGSNCIIGSNTEVKGTVPSDSLVYTKSKLLVKKHG